MQAGASTAEWRGEVFTTTGVMSDDDARGAITSLADAGRLSQAGAYLEELRS